MSDGISQAPITRSLGDIDRELNAINNLQTGRGNTGSLRSMFGAFTPAAESAKALVTTTQGSLQRSKPKVSLPAPGA